MKEQTDKSVLERKSLPLIPPAYYGPKIASVDMGKN
jgi:hypothetical protein